MRERFGWWLPARAASRGSAALRRGLRASSIRRFFVVVYLSKGKKDKSLGKKSDLFVHASLIV